MDPGSHLRAFPGRQHAPRPRRVQTIVPELTAQGSDSIDELTSTVPRLTPSPSGSPRTVPLDPGKPKAIPRVAFGLLFLLPPKGQVAKRQAKMTPSRRGRSGPGGMEFSVI